MNGEKNPEYLNRFRMILGRGLDGDAEAISIAASMAERGFKLRLWNDHQEVQTAVEAIILGHERDGVDLSCRDHATGKCGLQLVCAINRMIDRKVDEGEIGETLGHRSKVNIDHNQVDGCALAVEAREVTARRVEAALMEHAWTSDGATPLAQKSGRW